MDKLINAGYGNCINSGKVISVVSIDSAPSKRLVSMAKDAGKAIDVSILTSFLGSIPFYVF